MRLKAAYYRHIFQIMLSWDNGCRTRVTDERCTITCCVLIMFRKKKPLLTWPKPPCMKRLKVVCFHGRTRFIFLSQQNTKWIFCFDWKNFSKLIWSKCLQAAWRKDLNLKDQPDTFTDDEIKIHTEDISCFCLFSVQFYLYLHVFISWF